MKIMHLMLACFYIDNYSYQENLLPKYHKMQGHDVEIVASLFTFDENGKGKWLAEGKKYINEDGIPVTRLAFANEPLSNQLRRYKGLMLELERFAPDIIFIHGVQFCDIGIVRKYLKKHQGVKIFVDNHSDFGNSGKNWISKNIQHKMLWRSGIRKISPYTEKFYGVLPARVDFLCDIYKTPKNKTELLVMGADDNAILEAEKENARDKIREKFGIGQDDILLMTAGKIDSNKPQVLSLMKAVKEIADEKIKLLIFGTIVPELKEEFDSLVDGKKIIFGGWMTTNDTYRNFSAADLLIFPGLHSVYWEQAVGFGVPCLFRKLDGFTHIDCGGNCKFITDISKDGIKKSVEEIIGNPKILEEMKKSADNCKEKFRYSVIAKDSIR